MGFKRIAGKGRDNLLVFVDDHVDDVGQFRHLRRRDHILVQRVAFENTRSRVRAVDEFRAVVAHHGLAVADPWQHTLAPAGKAREEMRFNEAFRNEQVRVRCDLVDNAVRTGRQHPDLHIRVCVS